MQVANLSGTLLALNRLQMLAAQQKSVCSSTSLSMHQVLHNSYTFSTLIIVCGTPLG